MTLGYSARAFANFAIVQLNDFSFCFAGFHEALKVKFRQWIKSEKKTHLFAIGKDWLT